MAEAIDLPVHFFTIVLNGEPFIRYHLNSMKALPFRWHWHVIEGLADLKHDTSWSLPYGATLPTDAACNGRSIDGTAEYLDQIAGENRENITVYRAPRKNIWDGKLEMVAAPLKQIHEPCLLWEIDADELWTTGQLVRGRELFLDTPERNAAIFYCWYFVGPQLVIDRRRKYSEIQWRRVWRFRPGMRWFAHEPPMLGTPTDDPRKWIDVATQNPFGPAETEQHGLVFQHFAYATETQLRFKERYYGYKGITEQWRSLQDTSAYPVRLKDYFNWPWVSPDAMVERVGACGIDPLAKFFNGQWQFL
jgi:hypothetical protein